ncbi:MAG: copper resistance protein B, partial [Balneolaceae bacterium]
DFAYNREFNHSRAFGVIGIQGLAPYFFEVDGGLFVSEDGDISANFEAEYDLLFTQRLIGQPRLATSIAVQEVEEWGVGSGFNNVQLGFRLRYEIKREFAPYVGISWNRKLGETADFTRLEGGEVGTLGLVGGVRMWF